MIQGTSETPPKEQILTPATKASANSLASAPFKPLYIALAVLVLAFAKPLYDLFRFSLSTELFSHILLIPVISGYLIWQAKGSLPRPTAERSLPLTLACVLPAALCLTFYFTAERGATLSKADYLAFTIFPFVCLLVAVVLWFGGTPFARSIAFPLGFLLFLVPFPDRVTDALEIASQHASANAYQWMMDLSRATYFRQGLIFSLPGLNLQVAQECSGIRSSFVLFMTSLLAAHMFLRSQWKRALLAFAVIPLGIIRNGFRIYTLSMLTIHWDSRVIDSPLHHKGGPIFFVISLVPFFLLLFWLRRSETRTARVANSTSNS